MKRALRYHYAIWHCPLNACREFVVCQFPNDCICERGYARFIPLENVRAVVMRTSGGRQLGATSDGRFPSWFTRNG